MTTSKLDTLLLNVPVVVNQSGLYRVSPAFKDTVSVLVEEIIKTEGGPEAQRARAAELGFKVNTNHS